MSKDANPVQAAERRLVFLTKIADSLGAVAPPQSLRLIAA